MKNIRLLSLFFGLALFLWNFAIPVHALPVLPFPNANQLAGSVFVQPFAGLTVVSEVVGLTVVSETAGIGVTDFFFASIPNLPQVVNIDGNFLVFDPSGNPLSFTLDNIMSVEVIASPLFTPAFGAFNFAGHSSLTFTDSIDFDVVTFFAGDPTLAFTFPSHPTQQISALAEQRVEYFFRFLTLGYPVGTIIVFDDVETGVKIPESSTFFLIASGLAFVAARSVFRKRKRVRADYHLI